VAVSVAFVVIAILGMVLAPAHAARYDLIASPSGAGRYVAGAVELLGLAVLALRWRTPVLVMVVEVAAVAAVHLLVDGNQAAFPLFLVVVATYTVAAVEPARRAVALASGAWLVLLVTAMGVGPAVAGAGPTAFQYLLLFVAVVAVGMNRKNRRDLLASYQARAEQAEREQELIAAQAVTAERHRIARDLHDIVAHHVSLLVVQAGAVRESVPADHVTRDVLDSMIAGGRQAMEELRDMLDALKVEADSGAAPLQPGPGVEQVTELVNGAKSAGLPVELRIAHQRRGSLTPATSVAAYRIVQEALTNAAKHAPGAPVTVTLEYAPQGLEVRIANPAGKAAAPVLVGGHHGLAGMHERATLAHGELTAGPVADGYLVAAVLPYAPEGSR
jgi:signal transduction histidine kinase